MVKDVERMEQQGEIREDGKQETSEEGEVGTNEGTRKEGDMCDDEEFNEHGWWVG